MSLYGLAEDLMVVREALREADEDDENRLWIEYATLGVVAVGTTVSVWSCVRHSYDTRVTPGVSAALPFVPYCDVVVETLWTALFFRGKPGGAS